MEQQEQLLIKKTEKGILKISVFETVDGWATMEKEYISDKKELNK